MRVHSPDKIQKIKYLRKRGHSINEISKDLCLPKTTVWKYVQGIRIPIKYINILKSKQKSSIYRSHQDQERAEKAAREMIKDIDKSTKVLIAAMLYWAEGSKKDLCLSNTDPKLIKTFLECIKELGAKKDDISISIRLYEDISQSSARNFWSNVTNIPAEKIKHINVLKGNKKGKLPFGMCRIRIRKGGYLLKLINAIKEIVNNKM